MTLIHGDAHAWNCFLARGPRVARDVWFDWDNWRVDAGASDLAYLIALAVLWQVATPVKQYAGGLPPLVWWSHLERIRMAVDDLGCRELLAPWGTPSAPA